ncbi:holo-ACP synthase [Buchnera aphidicola]|uniref:Holo-[acyl-carrier-protein] synthase n=1 Tax=Buchnera aphidicola subsp. Tuberolachnus salignus TaxID=98804 RepID=A0A160SVY2_BUCTT|nr:holo-ACP synthase [Buchnera aphidicola]CUR53147.1 Holo-[acyl-carrier-protein] synthase [Buchnera aphidicola (Tuberolachnus salignus)]
MSIFGIGIDTIEIKRFKELLHKYSLKIPLKILSTLELKEFMKKKKKSSFLAKRFTAKEACMKALGIGFTYPNILKNLEIFNNRKGKPKIRILKKKIHKIFQKKTYKIHLSITDTKKYAQSIVLLEY